MTGNTEVKETGGKKSDAGKPEMMYFYFPGYIAIHYHDVPQCGREVGLSYHNNVLLPISREMVAGDISKLMDGLRDFEHDIIKSWAARPEFENLKHASIRVSEIGKHGSEKYGFLNYTKGFVWSRIVNAIARHVKELVDGNFNDQDSTLDHRYHILANIYILAEHIENGTGENDLIVEDNHKDSGV